MPHNSLEIFTVDAFTSKPFSGNPAAVCLLPEARDEAWMQTVAMEINLSETAFVYRMENGFSLRWFTPAIEVDLCGHATLATSHVLWEQGWAEKDQALHFHTKSGELIANHENGWITLDFPAVEAASCVTPEGLLKALGVSIGEVLSDGTDYMVAVIDEEQVINAKPDMAVLARLPVRGVILTAEAIDKDYDFVSRFFAPGAGIDEDPVTGSAHCTLAPFWGKRLKKTEMTGYQASARGGLVRAQLKGDRVLLKGQAIMVMSGQFYV